MMAGSSPRRSALGLVCALVCLGVALPARAWTRTLVESAEAEVDVQRSGQAQVSLVLGLRVAGGWLSRFELALLDPVVTLDPDKPAWLTCDDGRKLMPVVKQRDHGRLVFSFPDRHEAPHRGLHKLGIVYSTVLAAAEAGGDGDRKPSGIGFSLPAFETDLRRADIWLNAPLGSALASDAEADPAVQREQRPLGPRVLLHLGRTQLPRTVVFGAQLELPSAPSASLRASRSDGAARQSAAAFWAALLVLVLCLLKRATVAADAASRGLHPLAWLPLPEGLRRVVMCGLALPAAVCYAPRPALALALLAGCVTLGLDRGFSGPGGVPQPAAEPLPSRFPLAELFSARSWFDATTPLGLGLLGSAYALCALRLALGVAPGLWLELLVLVTPLFWSATRVQRATAASA